MPIALSYFFERLSIAESFSSDLGRAYLAQGYALQAQGNRKEALASVRLAAQNLENTLGSDNAESRVAQRLVKSISSPPK
jgi:hypothetical protein